MFVAKQQLTSLSPRREILSHNHYLIARDGCAAELSVARSTMPNYRKCATFMSLKILHNNKDLFAIIRDLEYNISKLFLR